VQHLLVDIFTMYTAVFWIGNTVHTAVFCTVTVYKVKVKQSLYRPGQDLWVPRQSAHECGTVVCPVHRLLLLPGNEHFLGVKAELTPGP